MSDLFKDPLFGSLVSNQQLSDNPPPPPTPPAPAPVKRSWGDRLVLWGLLVFMVFTAPIWKGLGVLAAQQLFH